MNGNGLRETLAALRRVQKLAGEAAFASMVESAREVVASQERLAPEESGDLADSIALTLPGETTPPFSKPGNAGASQLAKEGEIIITAGNEKVRYAHIAEHGSSKAEAQPFFFPPWRMMRRRVRQRARRAYNRAAQGAWNRR